MVVLSTILTKPVEYSRLLVPNQPSIATNFEESENLRINGVRNPSGSNIAAVFLRIVLLVACEVSSLMFV